MLFMLEPKQSSITLDDGVNLIAVDVVSCSIVKKCLSPLHTLSILGFLIDNNIPISCPNYDGDNILDIKYGINKDE